MKNNKQLLFLAEPNDEHRGFVISEVLADLDDETQHLLRETGAYDRVIGYMCEMWLRATPVSPLVAYVATGEQINRGMGRARIEKLAETTKNALEILDFGAF